MNIIKLSKLNKYYYNDNNSFHALIDFNLNIKKGDFLIITGPSGSGKSTLINILGLIDIEFEGDYLFYNQDIKKMNDVDLSKFRNEKIGFVFQNFNLLQEQTVYENIELPLLYSGKSSNEIRSKVNNCSLKLGVDDKINNFCFNLSGGQQQRVAIARALVNDPKLIIADEPTGALDSKTSKDILEIFKQLNREGITIILITHDLNIAKQFKHKLNILDGKCNESI